MKLLEDQTQQSSEDAALTQKVGDTSLMYDMFLVCRLLIEGPLTLVIDPTSLLQQSLVNTVPHIP